MKKLIELLNEWYEERYNVNPCFDRFEDYWGNDYWYFTSSKRERLMNETEVWTKKYWFIKRLVENDKLWDNKDSDRYTMMKLMRAEAKEQQIFEWTEYYERVIMLLSIQDNPIDFLITILK